MLKIISAILVLTSCLVACDSNNTSHTFEIQSFDTKQLLTTSTPYLMRSIPVETLSLSITIDETETSYQGVDTIDGKWLIDVELIPDQTYDLLVRWYTSGHLLLEEFGEITTPTVGGPLTPILDYRSAGRPEFDVDCDSISNLEEIVNQSDFNPSSTAQGETTCDNTTHPTIKDIAERLTDSEQASISQSHNTLVTDVNEKRLTSYDHSILINRSNSLTDISITTYLYGENDDPENGPLLDNFATIAFRQKPGLPKYMEFSLAPATDTLNSGIENQVCTSFSAPVFFETSAGWSCTVIFDWKEDRWYSIRLEETTPNTWNARIIDQESQVTQSIATFVTPENLMWLGASVDLSDNTPHRRAECLAGLPTLSITFKRPKVNNLPRGTYHARPSNCLYGGGGWSAGLRTVDGELEYKMSIGMH